MSAITTANREPNHQPKRHDNQMSWKLESSQSYSKQSLDVSAKLDCLRKKKRQVIDSGSIVKGQEAKEMSV